MGFVIAKRHVIAFGLIPAAIAIAGCSGSPSPCHIFYVGSAGFDDSTLVVPASGSTGVPLTTRTLVFDGPGVVELVAVGSNATPIAATPTALPSPLPTNGSAETDYAVSVPQLQGETTYQAEIQQASDNTCAAGAFTATGGTFTTQ